MRCHNVYFTSDQFCSLIHSVALLAFLSDMRVSSTIFIGHHIMVACGTISQVKWRRGEEEKEGMLRMRNTLRGNIICARGSYRITR